MKIVADVRKPSGKDGRRLARQGRLAAVVYGHRVPPRPLSLDLKEFERVYREAGHTHLVDLQVSGGGSAKVLVKAIQVSPRTGRPLHVDFHQVSLRERLHTEVPVVLAGDNQLVRQGEAELVQLVHQLRVECLPTELPEVVEVPVSGLTHLDQGVRADELSLPPGVELLSSGDEVLVKLAARRAAEGRAAPEAAAEIPAAPPSAVASES